MSINRNRLLGEACLSRPARAGGGALPTDLRALVITDFISRGELSPRRLAIHTASACRIVILHRAPARECRFRSGAVREALAAAGGSLGTFVRIRHTLRQLANVKGD